MQVMYTNELAMICHKSKVLEEKHPAKFPPVQSNPTAIIAI